MQLSAPPMLLAALTSGTWRDPGPETLRKLFGRVAKLPDLRLYSDLSTMQFVRTQLIDAGYVDDPEFCFVRDESGRDSSEDPRLVFDAALIIGGSVVPGDDVLIALDLACEDPPVLVFDWTKPVPMRWVRIGSLSGFIAELARVFNE